MRDETPTTPILLRRLAANVVELFRTYALLAGQEARAVVRDVLAGALFLAAAVLLSALALALVVVTLILLLSLILPPWAAAAVVLAATALAAAGLVVLGVGRFRRRRLPKLWEAFKEDMRWLRRELQPRD